MGNKADLEESRVVSKELGMKLAQDYGPKVEWIETSAKSALNVEEVFTGLARRIKEEKAKQKVQEQNSKKRRRCSIL